MAGRVRPARAEAGRTGAEDATESDMSKILIPLLFLIIGLFAGSLVVAPLMPGAAAGIGIATGLSAGICSTVKAAMDEDLLTAEQVDQVLTRAASNVSGATGDAGEIVGSAAQCDEILAKLAEVGGE